MDEMSKLSQYVSEDFKHLKCLNYLNCLKKPGDPKMSEVSDTLTV